MRPFVSYIYIIILHFVRLTTIISLFILFLGGVRIRCDLPFSQKKREVMPMVKTDYILFAIEVLLLASFLKILIKIFKKPFNPLNHHFLFLTFFILLFPFSLLLVIQLGLFLLLFLQELNLRLMLK